MPEREREREYDSIGLTERSQSRGAEGGADSAAGSGHDAGSHVIDRIDTNEGEDEDEGGGEDDRARSGRWPTKRSAVVIAESYRGEERRGAVPSRASPESVGVRLEASRLGA